MMVIISNTKNNIIILTITNTCSTICKGNIALIKGPSPKPVLVNNCNPPLGASFKKVNY